VNDRQGFTEAHATNRHVNGSAGGAPIRAVVLAGGRGRRLAPYTSILPKPLMPIGDRAILEIVVEQLAASGIVEITFCVGHLSHLIRAVFDAGRSNGAAITYVQEQDALGTAGPLRLIERPENTLLVMNGDVLTTLDYLAFLGHHRESGNVLTIATHERTIKIDYGVLSSEEVEPGRRLVTSYAEKPEIVSTVSMGIYALEPECLEYVPPDSYFDFPELVDSLLQAGRPVGSYAYGGTWFDIGRQDDYEEAVSAWEAGRLNGSPNAP
jgi:NDP-mannose synthase